MHAKQHHILTVTYLGVNIDTIINQKLSNIHITNFRSKEQCNSSLYGSYLQKKQLLCMQRSKIW
jgi:hypothetical protein